MIFATRDARPRPEAPAPGSLWSDRWSMCARTGRLSWGKASHKTMGFLAGRTASFPRTEMANFGRSENDRTAVGSRRREETAGDRKIFSSHNFLLRFSWGRFCKGFFQ